MSLFGLMAHRHATRGSRSALSVAECDVLSQRNVLTIGIAQNAMDLCALDAADSLNLRCRVVDQCSADLERCRILLLKLE